MFQRARFVLPPFCPVCSRADSSLLPPLTRRTWLPVDARSQWTSDSTAQLPPRCQAALQRRHAGEVSPPFVDTILLLESALPFSPSIQMPQPLLSARHRIALLFGMLQPSRKEKRVGTGWLRRRTERPNLR